MGEKLIILLTLLSILNDLCTKSELKCSRKIKYEYCGTIYTCACAFASKKCTKDHSSALSSTNGREAECVRQCCQLQFVCGKC